MRFSRQSLIKAARYLFFPVSLFYLELVVVLYAFKSIALWSVVYIFLFSAVGGAVLYLLSSVWKSRKTRRVVSLIMMLIVTLIFGTQAVYFNIFKTFALLSSAIRAGDVLGEFWPQMFSGIWKTKFIVILLFVPFILTAVFGGKLGREAPIRKRPAIWIAMCAILLNAATVLCILLNTSGIMPYKYVYADTFAPDLAIPRFGVMTTVKLDIKALIQERAPDFLEMPTPANSDIPAIGSPKPSPAVSDNPGPSSSPSSESVVYGDNVLAIDFDALIAAENGSEIKDMHEYFKNILPTAQNEYTGMFEGKNLIFIVAEGFSALALDDTHTPTLSRMAGEGFVFNNYYNPVWSVSTSDGEYVASTGLIPKTGVWSFSKSSSNYMPFGFGNLMGELGYEGYAYHNHTYTYYDRHKSHPNMGYSYKGIGNGLDVKKQWPASDLEMMEVTLPEYIGTENFVTYYMTVSGHLEYNFYGNSMAAKHKQEVSDLPYSEPARAYIACQMEFDQAVGYLIDELERAGKLDDTVIVITGDHYPYGLEHETMEELNGGTLDKDFEIYRSTLIIWNSEMETVQVDKYCSALDIMPTVANLFGLPYDSRLVAGRDILSDAPGLVIFNNRSFITEYGRYNSRTDKFTLNEEMAVDEGYALGILKEVNNKFKYSALILTNDYYAKVLKAQ